MLTEFPMLMIGFPNDNRDYYLILNQNNLIINNMKLLKFLFFFLFQLHTFQL